MADTHATANEEQTFCGLSICGCGCFGRFKASIDDVECVDCLREIIRGLVEYGDYNPAFVRDGMGYYKGIHAPRS